MPAHLFGGPWTERKLSVVRRYLETYAQALKNQAFERVYVDAFAGTGDRTDNRRASLPLLDLPEFDAVAKGSARIALESNRPFIGTSSSSAQRSVRVSCQYSSRSMQIAASR
jgi:three-Cys-motif partner protein